MEEGWRRVKKIVWREEENNKNKNKKKAYNWTKENSFCNVLSLWGVGGIRFFLPPSRAPFLRDKRIDEE